METLAAISRWLAKQHVVTWCVHQEGELWCANAFYLYDPERVALWGVSLSGGHVISIAAEDPRIAAVSALVPMVDGRAALAQARPGVPYEAGHVAAVETLTEGLLKLGLLKGTLEKNLAEGHYRRFYRHNTGHWLGLDVHDVGEYRVGGEWRVLEPGMSMTVEPGIYISPDNTDVPKKWRGIGVRIEDDVVVTKTGCEVLTNGVPKTVAEIEALMAEAKAQAA